MAGKKRRRWGSEEKLRIVLAGLDGTIEVSELCRREGISPTQYYGWKKQLLGSASKVFAGGSAKPSVKERRLETELARAKDVIAEITAENLDLKKRALGLEDHGKMPAELQEHVHAEVVQAKRRSGWPVRRTLGALGVPPSSYYRWLKEEALARASPAEAARPAQPYEATPEEKEAVIRSDNGSGYISREFGGVLDEHGLVHRRIKPHCPEENGLMERAQRTFEEALEGEELESFVAAERSIDKMIGWYNAQRLHSALGYLRPVDYYRGKPEELYQVRRLKLWQARHERKQRNLQLRQRTLPLEN